MRINGSSEPAAQVRPSGKSRRILKALVPAARIALVAGALWSVSSMFWVGRRNPSRLLLGLFLIWDISPFVGLAIADLVARYWSIPTRASLYVVMLILSLCSMLIYGDVVWRPRPLPAFMFLVVPFGSWLVMAIVLPAAAFVSRKLARPGSGV